MISVEYSGQMANQLFGYCFARIVAEHHDLAMGCPPRFHSGQRHTRSLFDEILIPDQVPGRMLSGPQVHFDSELVNADGHELFNMPPAPILLTGHWQWQSYYEPRREQIRREWLPLRKEWEPADRIALHLRLGDFLNYNWVLPIDSYVQAVMALPKLDVMLVTDETEDNATVVAVTKELRKRGRRVIYQQQLAWQDFMEILRSTHVVRNWMSTFPWWAAFLGDPETITAIRDKRQTCGAKGHDIIRDCERVVDVV